MAPPTPRLAKTASGKLAIKFACPRCGENLAQGIEQVGNAEKCFKCKQVYVVPGKELVAKLKPAPEPRTPQPPAEPTSPTNEPDLPLQDPIFDSPSVLDLNSLPPAPPIQSRFSTTYRKPGSTSKAGSKLNRKDLLSWAVQFTRDYLSVIMIVGLIICGLATFVFILAMFVNLVQLLGSNFSLLLLLGWIGMLIGGLIALAIVAASVVVSIGSIGVFFEIERNTRAQRP